jgi:DNA-binding NarL/FixJ family response regulator
VEGELAALGYDIVATARSPEQALELTGNLRPDAVVVALDSLDRASALLAVRMLSHRRTCAVVVLVEHLDRATQAQLKTVTPHAVAPWPIPGEILDVVIHAALEGAAQRVQARLARLDAGARPGVAAGELEVFLRIAQSRALRHATSFAAGAVAVVCDATGGTPAADMASKAAERLRSELRQHDVVLERTDGTLVFIAEDVGPDELEPLGDRILHALSGSPSAPGTGRAAWPAIGLAPCSAYEQDARAVLNAAAHAMAQARAAGRACWRIARQSSDAASTPVNEGPLDAEGPQERDTRVRPLVLLQRTLGWVSLGVLFWIAANYLSSGTADWLAEQTHGLRSFLMSLR